MTREYHGADGFWDQERQVFVFVPAFDGGRTIREQRNIPECTYRDLDGFIEELRKLGEGLSNASVTLRVDEEGDASMFIMGDRPRTPADNEWLLEAKAAQDKRDQKDADYLLARIARSPVDPWGDLGK